MTGSLQDRWAALSPAQRELLARKFKEQGLDAVPLDDRRRQSSQGSRTTGEESAFVPKRSRREETMDFSLFFFSGDGSTEEGQRYRLLLESAAYADEHGFAAVWTPERHFEDFGGLYPNPSVLSAALAVLTRRVEIRAGSVVLPLHHPIRFTEEWAVVDNLSGGRVSVAFAAGWHPADFLLAPVQTPEYYADRKQEMFRAIGEVRRLWNGETLEYPDAAGMVHAVRTLPRPVRAPLDVWIATNGSTETYREAGRIGAHILTGITGSKFAELEEKIAMYRETLRESGYDPASKKVALMLHTCLGESNEAVKGKVAAPLKAYLKTFISQQRNILNDYAAMSEADLEVIVSRAFELYFEESGLLGTPDKCAKLVETLRDIGVNEIACLIDFGVDHNAVRESLELLSGLKEQFSIKEKRVQDEIDT
ncbi:MupA/Atu3671 family FMN-dependent luciferase-like monooxygenase [Paenibacillus caseinilyticus]|uniref:Protein CtaG n=1 Tax=Paenibacillus mucilaginosus K02 TaxID=997761 RepID=I0BLV3_9BACL|nr:MupA/Atu3671 family FMN-dependent luciferase-like monooxygenase [Paenibacillus mucilaginosus]AFH63350.1 protein CtaG [Paenibacillus mucilaginosus K02]